MKLLPTNTVLINAVNDPEFFLALKRVCQYLTEEAWNITTDSSEGGLEFMFAVSKTKRYEKEVKILANIDGELAWGQMKYKNKDGLWITKDGGNLNPWYEGNLTLNDFLESLDLLAEVTAATMPQYFREAEFLHYHDFLWRWIPRDLPATAMISIGNLHPKLIEHCARRFNNHEYSDAILAAYKVVINEIKDVSGIKDTDGKALIEKAFSLNKPIIKLNPLISTSDRDEQQGFMLLYSGAQVGIRNPKAHDLVIQEDKLKALKYLSFASLLLERLDTRIEPAPRTPDD